ncbi:MAG: hypothetical protein R3F59_08525 [Myxococcota bacterium]
MQLVPQLVDGADDAVAGHLAACAGGDLGGAPVGEGALALGGVRAGDLGGQLIVLDGEAGALDLRLPIGTGAAGGGDLGELSRPGVAVGRERAEGVVGAAYPDARAVGGGLLGEALGAGVDVGGDAELGGVGLGGSGLAGGGGGRGQAGRRGVTAGGGLVGGLGGLGVDAASHVGVPLGDRVVVGCGGDGRGRGRRRGERCGLGVGLRFDGGLDGFGGGGLGGVGGVGGVGGEGRARRRCR